MNPTAYDTDFYTWTQEQAQFLRDHAWDALDLVHLIEEVVALGSEQEHAVESQLRRVLHHLLKWQYQKSHRTRSWKVSILNSRFEVNKRLRRNPGLRGQVPAYIADVYPEAVRLASVQTGLPPSAFPPSCEWPEALILDPDFFPGE